MPHRRRRRVLIHVLVRLKLGEDIDELANAPARQRLAIIQQRIVVDDPGLGFRQFFRRGAGSDDFGDGHVVDLADCLDNVITCELRHRFHPSESRVPPARERDPEPESTGRQRAEFRSRAMKSSISSSIFVGRILDVPREIDRAGRLYSTPGTPPGGAIPV
jgi:hypothetical protein